MKYYEWWGEPDAVDVDFPEDDFEGWWMIEGRPVIGWQPGLSAIYHGEKRISFHFGLADNTWPVFSSHMRHLLENTVPGDVQFLPFSLVSEHDASEVKDFFVGQLLRLVDCLDRKRTKVRKNWEPINDRGDFATFRPIVLSPQLIGGNKLFRIKGQCRSIVVRDDLRVAIERAGFIGQRFDELPLS